MHHDSFTYNIINCKWTTLGKCSETLRKNILYRHLVAKKRFSMRGTMDRLRSSKPFNNRGNRAGENQAISTTFGKIMPGSDISKDCPRSGKFHGTRQTWICIVLRFKFYLWLNVCFPFHSIRNSPCGRCWQRRVAQWHLHLHCFSEPGKGGLHSFTLNKVAAASEDILHTKPIQLIAAIVYLAQGAIGLFIKEFDLICSRAGLFVGKTPGHLSKKKRQKCFSFTCWGNILSCKGPAWNPSKHKPIKRSPHAFWYLNYSLWLLIAFQNNKNAIPQYNEISWLGSF